MHAHDIAQLRELFAEQDRKFTAALAGNGKMTRERFTAIDKRIDAQTLSFASALRQSRDDIVREIREETRAMLLAAENRIVAAVVGSVGDLLDASVLPQITELQREMDVVKRHLKLA